MKLRVKLTLSIVSLVVIVMTTLSIVLVSRASSVQAKLAYKNLEDQGQILSQQLSSYYQTYYDFLLSLSHIFNEYEYYDPEARRNQFNDVMYGIIASNPHFVGIFSVWEPGIIDGLDEDYAGTSGTDRSGNYMTWYHRFNGGIELHAFSERSSEYSAIIRAMPTRTQINVPTFQDVAGTKLFVGSMYVPIQLDEDGTIVGIIGVDINFNPSQEIVRQMTPYGDGDAAVYASDGTIVAHKDSSKIGEKFEQASREVLGTEGIAHVQNAFKTGDPVVFTSEGRIIQTYPFTVGGSSTYWMAVVSAIEATVFVDRTSMISFSIIAILIGLIGSVVLSFIVVIGIATPIISVTKTLKDISEGEGDLTAEIQLKSQDEIGELAQYFNLTIRKIRAMVQIIKSEINKLSDIGHELSTNMTQTASAINEITATMQSVKGQVNNQSTSVVQTNATMDRINENIGKLSENIEKQTLNVDQSSTSIEEMLANIQSVTQTLIKNTQNVQDLSKASEVGRSGLQEMSTDIQEIARESAGLFEINSVMEGIASQTNLLSMNAAIEAAHAGEAGKGFAVVADEIRKLAESSGEQSQTISKVLKKIKDSIDKIIQSTDAVLNKFEIIDSGVKKVLEQEETVRNAMEEQGIGSKQILESIGTLNDLSKLVKEESIEMLKDSTNITMENKNLEQITQEITGSMTEMASGTSEINNAVEHVSDLSTKNRESIGTLMTEVSRFKVD
ncbi:putative methyl-accepting chemotaxis protein [Pillotina sp. SPG140]|jgi:methyl-accepting chemotaxis protein